MMWQLIKLAQVMSKAFPPHWVYFDTEPLIKAGWPNPSVQLLQLMDQLQKNLSYLGLPEVVRMELEEHTLREARNEWLEANEKIQRVLRKVGHVPSFKELPPLPSREVLKGQLGKMTADFVKRFDIVPMTSRPLADFVNLAINRGATFTDTGRGFQDAVIVCSVLDHMKGVKNDSAVLVSDDNHFQSKGVTDICGAAGVNLRIVRNLDGVEQMLKEYLDEVSLRNWTRESARLKATLESKKADIEKYLIDHLAVEAFDVIGFQAFKNVKLISLDLISIENVYFSPSKDDRRKSSSNLLKISVDVKVRFLLHIEPWAVVLPESFKLVDDLRPVQIPPEIANRSSEREATVVVEAEATRSGSGYSNIELKRATLK